MSKEDNGGPAFPAQFFDERAIGMTLRDFFAAKAMQGIISASGDGEGYVDYKEFAVAEHSYAMADAMLEARKK